MSNSLDACYRPLFDLNPQPMWVYDRDTLRFLAVNQATVAQYGYSPEEFRAMRITDIRPPEDVPALLAHLASAGGREDRAGTWRHRHREGRVLLVEIRSREVTFDQRPARLVLATDVTAREEESAAMRRHNEAHERQYAALVALTRSGTLAAPNALAALHEITETTAHTLGIERVSVWRFTPSRDGIEALDLFERSAARHSPGSVLRAYDFPGYFRALAENDVIVADDAAHDPRTREFTEVYLRPHGITSMLDTPILVDGRLEGVLCCEHVGPMRRWSPGERSFAMSATNLVSLIIAQRSRAESEARLRAIFDGEPECVKIVSHTGELLDMNPAGVRIVEADSREQVVGRSVQELVHADDWPAFAALHRRVGHGETGSLQFRITGLKGTQKWMETHAAPLRDAGGAIAGVLSVTHDITERREAEAALAESRRQLATLLGNLPGAVYRCRNDRDRTVEFVSDGVTALTGYEPAQFLTGAVTFGELVHPEDRERVWAEVLAAVERDVAFEIEYRMRTAHGTEKWVSERGQPVHVAGGAVLIEGFITDVTERRRAEEQALHGQKLESVGRLAGGIAHDFNNLLTVILGTIDLNLGELPADDPLHQDLLVIRREGERAARLTSQLLAFSRRQVLQLQLLNLDELVSDTLAMLQRLIGEDIEIRFRAADALGPVRADPGQFGQVLMNLAVNARDAMPTGGTLTIETRQVQLDEAIAPAFPGAAPGAYVMLAVSDTGIGMDERVRQHVFEPFFTTKPVGQGTGLGLATVYGIVQQSGGSIRVESEIGEGTRFEIFLPVAEAPQPEPAGSTAPTWSAAGTETILLVEDEPALRDLTARLLQSAGYSVLSAAGGEEALELLQASTGSIHLLLTDVVMPRMSGSELARRVAELHPDLCIVYMSGYTDQEIIHHGVDGKQVAVLSKPFELDELGRTIRRALDSWRTRAAAARSNGGGR